MTNERTARRLSSKSGIRHGTAFLVEGLVLLAFLVSAIAVFTVTFSKARAQDDEALVLTRATFLAQHAAEEFCACPEEAEGTHEENGLTVVVSTTSEEVASGEGTLWRASIVVSEGDMELYELDTARYVAGGGATS